MNTLVALPIAGALPLAKAIPDAVAPVDPIFSLIEAYRVAAKIVAAAASFLRKARIGGNGAPSFRACMRTFLMLRWSAAAARTTDAPRATNSRRHTLSSSVHFDFKRTMASLLTLAV
jgi:hypothetical protein